MVDFFVDLGGVLLPVRKDSYFQKIFIVCLLVIFWRQGYILQPKLDSNWQSSCLSLLSAVFTGMYPCLPKCIVKQQCWDLIQMHRLLIVSWKLNQKSPQRLVPEQNSQLHFIIVIKIDEGYGLLCSASMGNMTGGQSDFFL